MQILNVTLGGTLIVDLVQQVQSRTDHNQLRKKDRVVHEVELDAESILARRFGQRVIQVNSSHHQAVDRVAAPLRVTGPAPDGVVEVLELREEYAALLPYLLAVQFHPERLVRSCPVYNELFRGFVEACAIDRKARYEAQSARSG